MQGFYGFSDLKIGMRVNVEGEYDLHDGTWRARQISIKKDGNLAEMEGRIESIDAPARTLRLHGLTLEMRPGFEILDLDKRPIGFEVLSAGTRIKVKGRIAGKRLEPERIKLKEETPDACDEMEGAIAGLDPGRRTLTVLGYRVVCAEDLEIEA